MSNWQVAICCDDARQGRGLARRCDSKRVAHGELARSQRATKATETGVWAHASRFKAVQPGLTAIAEATLGVLVTLTSVGAGALCAVALTFLYPLRLTPARLIATDIAHAIPLALFAGLGHLLVGHVDFTLLLNLLLGSAPGVLIGARLSSRLSHNVLRIALAAVLTIVAIKMVVSL